MTAKYKVRLQTLCDGAALQECHGAVAVGGTCEAVGA